MRAVIIPDRRESKNISRIYYLTRELMATNYFIHLYTLLCILNNVLVTFSCCYYYECKG